MSQLFIATVKHFFVFANHILYMYISKAISGASQSRSSLSFHHNYSTIKNMKTGIRTWKKKKPKSSIIKLTDSHIQDNKNNSHNLNKYLKIRFCGPKYNKRHSKHFQCRCRGFVVHWSELPLPLVDLSRSPCPSFLY